MDRATGSSGYNRQPAGEKLTSFWAKLPLAQVEQVFGQDVVLAEGEFPGLGLKQLLRRNCYNVAYSKMSASLEDRPEHNHRFLVLGTPGIGKSVFLLDLLHRLACAGRTVVYYAPELLDEVLLFTPGGVVSADSPRAFREELKKPETWFLCDSVDYAMEPAVTVLASSPCDSTYHAFAKTVPLVLWMGPWSLDELQAARQLMPEPRPDAEMVEKLYHKCGGIPRYVLQHALVANILEVKLDDAISSFHLPTFLRAVQTIPVSAAPEAIHMLLHVKVNEDCQKVAVVFGSDEIVQQVLKKLQEDDCEEMQQILWRVPSSPTLVSQLGLLLRALYRH